MNQEAGSGNWRLSLGANPVPGGGVSFRVWAPRCNSVSVVREPGGQSWPMERREHGFFQVQITEMAPGDSYCYLLDGARKRPDPVARLLPNGVHGAAQVFDAGEYAWDEGAWRGIPLSDYVFYELHVGTFSQQGTFQGVIERLPYLKDLGITCVEIMPVAQFPGRRNWGYDGVGLYAVQDSYGGPAAFKDLVAACHRAGLAVCLDVVYNHLGPEGNYLREFGPYFTDAYRTPWGEALNYDGAGSDGVREYILGNALYWLTEYHVDALRLDAIHGIFDFSALHILEEMGTLLKAEAAARGRDVYLIAESDLNDPRVIRSREQGGWGLDAQWSDDFHHSLHVLLSGERDGYYCDYGHMEDLAVSLRRGFVYDGRYSSYRSRRHGAGLDQETPAQLVINMQNHDQVGNRAQGDRLTAALDFSLHKAAAVLLLMAPNLPFLFMGQEYGEPAPFQYFIDHGDPGLIEAVRKGRKEEFAAFGWNEVPDPYDEQAFLRSRLDWSLIDKGEHATLLALYRALLGLRRTHCHLENMDFTHIRTACDESLRQLLVAYPGTSGGNLLLLINLGETDWQLAWPDHLPAAGQEVLLDSEAREFGGKGGDADAQGPGPCSARVVRCSAS